MLHEALTARADPLYLALLFGLSHTTASKYTLVAGLIGAARSGSLDTATPLARRLTVSGGARAGSTTCGHAGTPGGA